MAKIRKPSKLSKPRKPRKPLSAAAKQKISQGLARVLGPTRGIDEYEPKPKKGTKANKPTPPKTGKNAIPDNLPNSQPLTRKQTRTEGNRPTPKPQRLERPKRPTTLKELTRPQLIEGLEYHRERGNKDAYNRIKQELDTRPTPNAKTSTPDTQIANDQRILQGYQKRQAELRLDREAEARAVLEARGVDTSEWEPIDEDVMHRARKRVERDIQKDTAQRAERRQQREAQQARQQQILERQAEARVILEARGQDTSDWHGIDPELIDAARLRLADQIAKDSTARNARQQRNTPTPTPNTTRTSTPDADATPQINTKAIPTVPKTPRKPQKQPTHPNHVQGGGHQASAEYLNPVEIRKEPHYEDDLNQLNAQLAESPTAEQKLLDRLENAQQRAAENRTNEENRHNQREATRLQVLAEDSGLIPNGNDNDPMGELDDQELDDFNAYMDELDARELETTTTPNDVIPTDSPTPNNMPTTRPGMTEDEKDAQYFTAESQYDPDYEEFLEWQRREHSEPLRNESEETADLDNLDTTTDAPTLSDEELEQRLNQRDNDDTTPDTEPENPTPPQPTTTPETEPATPQPQATDTPDSDGTQPQAKQPTPTPAPAQPETTPTPAERPAPTTRAAARPEPGTPDALTDEEQKEFDKAAEKEFRKQFSNATDEELIAELSQLEPRHPRAQALNRELDLRDDETSRQNANTYLRERSGRGNQGRRQPANTGETPNYNDENQLEQLETAAQQDTDRDQFNTQELQYMTFDELDAIDTADVDPVYAAAVDDAKETINPEHPGGILDSLKQNSTFTDYKRRLTDYDGLTNYVQEGEDLNTTDKDERAALNKRIDDRIKTNLGLAGNPRFAREAEQTDEYFDWENDLFTTQTNADGTIDDIREAGGRLKQGQTGRYGTVDEAETQISTELRDHIINNIGYLPNVENFQRIKRGQAPIPYTEDTAKEIRAERNARARQRPYKTKAQRAAAREQKIFNQNTRAPELERRNAQELQPAEGLEGVGVRAGRKAIMQPDLPQDMRDRPWEKQERIDLIQRHADTLNDKDLLQAVDNAKEDNSFNLGTPDIEETYRAEATKRGLIDAPEPEPVEPAKAPEPTAAKPAAPKPTKPTAKTTKAEPKTAPKDAPKATEKPAAPKTTTKPDTTTPQAKYSTVRKAVIAKNGTPLNNQKALQAMSDDDLNTAKTHAENLKLKNPKSQQHQAVIDAVEKELTTRNKPSTKNPTPKPAETKKPATPKKPTTPTKRETTQQQTTTTPTTELQQLAQMNPADLDPDTRRERRAALKELKQRGITPQTPPETKPAAANDAPKPAKPAAKPETPSTTKEAPKTTPTDYETQVAQAHENYTPTTKEKKPTNPGLFSTTTGIYGEPRRYSYNPQDGENVNLIHHPEPNTTWHLTKAQYLKNGTTKFTGVDLNTGKPVNTRTDSSGWLETRRPIDTSSIYTADTPQQYHAQQELEKKYPDLTPRGSRFADAPTPDAYNRRRIERTLAQEHITKNPQDTTIPTFTKAQVEARAKKDAEWALNNNSSGVKIAVIKPGTVVNGPDNYNHSIVHSINGRFYAPANTFLLNQDADPAAEFARLTANPDARIDAGSQGLVQPTKLEKFGYGMKLTGVNEKGETVSIKATKDNRYTAQLRQRTPLTYSNGDDLSAADAKAYAQAEHAIQDAQVKLNDGHATHRSILVAKQEEIKRNILNKGTKPTPTTTPAAPKKPTKTTTPDAKEKDLAHRLTGAATKELNSPTKDQQITKVIEEQHDKTQLLDRHPQLKEVYEALQKRNQQQAKTQERRHNIAQALTNDAGTGARQNPDLSKYTDEDLQDFIDNPQSTLKISQGGKGKVSKQEAPADKLKAGAQRELKKRQQATSFDDTPAAPKKTDTTQPAGTVAERAKEHTKNIDQKLYKAKNNFDTTRQNHPAGTPEFQKAEREYIELNVQSAKQHRDFEQQELDTRKQNGQPTKAQQKRLDRTEANLQKAQRELDHINEMRDLQAKSEAKKKTQTTTPPKGDTGLSFDDAPDQPDTTPAPTKTGTPTTHKWNEPYKTTLTDGAETHYYHTSDWNEPHTPSENMAVWNSQRPLQGQYTWQGQGRYGQYYAATPTNHTDYTTHNTNNLNLDSERIELVDNTQSLELADQRLQDLRGMTLQQARDNGANDRDLMSMVGLPYNDNQAEKQRIQDRRRDLYNQEQNQAPATELTAGLQQAHREATIGTQSRFTDEGRKATEKFNREHPLASYEELANKIREQEWADFQNADDNYRLVSINQMKDRNALGAHLTDEYTDAANKNGGFPTTTANTPQPTTSDPQTTNPGRLNDEDLIAEYHRIKGNKQARQQNLHRYQLILQNLQMRGLMEQVGTTGEGGTGTSRNLTKSGEELSQKVQSPTAPKHLDGIKYMGQTPTYDAPNPRKKQERIQQVEKATSELAKQMKHGDEPILVKTGDAGFYVKPIGKNQYRIWAPGKEYEAKTVRYDEPGGARWAPFYDLIDQTTPQKHTHGEQFTNDHKAPGESLNPSGSLRRGDYTIVSTPDGYQIIENFGRHKITKPYKQTLSAIRKKIDQMPGNPETN